MKKEAFTYGNYYHVFNRGNNGSPIFFEIPNYLYFLSLYKKYVKPIADTYAWCLMKNHFHFLVRIKEKEEIINENLSYSTVKKPKKINPSGQFSHFFNSYSQAINKRYSRTGSLFEKSFERKIILGEDYLRKLIYYIHNNPVHHGLKNTKNYPWSSYQTILSTKPTDLKRDEVLKWFDSVENFVDYHEKDKDISDIL
jgi:REP element-mobilizing transposase RayT